MKNKYGFSRDLTRGFDDFARNHNPSRKRYDDCLITRRDEKKSRILYDTDNFKCRNCGFFVTASREISGVNNRNHCPWCLWSRHMDLHTPGDRRSECLSRMEPIGLTIKQIIKRYGGENQGELMLVHQCTGCGKISINRVAADDDALRLYRVYQNSFLTITDVLTHLELSGVYLLNENDEALVKLRVFGVDNHPACICVR